jgi:hypothetical protein
MQAMARKKVAEVLVDTLVAAGVKRVYGVAGDSLNGITDSIRRRNDIRWIPVRHEETAAFAAGAEAHLTDGLGVCAGSCGPGNLHLINGLYDAHRSRVPVLAIAAHIPSRESGAGISRRPIRNISFVTVAIIVSWCRNRSRCLASWRSRSKQHAPAEVSRLWCCPAISRCERPWASNRVSGFGSRGRVFVPPTRSSPRWPVF